MTPRFERRHYNAIADALKKAYTSYPEDRDGIAVAISFLATMLEQDNPHFQRYRFLAASYGEGNPTP